MLTRPHILSADHFVRLRTLAEIINLKLTAVFIMVLVEETREYNNDLLKITDMDTFYRG